MLHQAHRSQAQENNLGIREDLLHQNLLTTANVAKMMIDKEGKTSAKERVGQKNVKRAEEKDVETTTLILPTGVEIG